LLLAVDPGGEHGEIGGEQGYVGAVAGGDAADRRRRTAWTSSNSGG
jgi:hypothetical protein